MKQSGDEDDDHDVLQRASGPGQGTLKSWALFLKVARSTVALMATTKTGSKADHHAVQEGRAHPSPCFSSKAEIRRLAAGGSDEGRTLRRALPPTGHQATGRVKHAKTTWDDRRKGGTGPNSNEARWFWVDDERREPKDVFRINIRGKGRSRRRLNMKQLERLTSCI